MQFVNKESSYGKRSRRQTRLIHVHVDNLRNRRLSADDMEAITACIPDLYRRIHPLTDLSSLSLEDKQLLRRPKRPKYFTPVPLGRLCSCGCGKRAPRLRGVWKAEYKSRIPVKPPGVVATTDTGLFQVFSGSLVTPPHPENLTTFSLNRWNARNQYDLVEVNGQRLRRVTSGVDGAGCRVLHRQFRVTVYRTDGQMMLSVFLSFPGDKVRRRFDLSDGAPSPTTRKREADVDETIGRSPPRSKTRLRL